MKVGCFALIDPFSTLDHQLERIADLGFKYADVTDSHPSHSKEFKYDKSYRKNQKGQGNQKKPYNNEHLKTEDSKFRPYTAKPRFGSRQSELQ